MAEDGQKREGLKSTGRLQASLEKVGKRGYWGGTAPRGRITRPTIPPEVRESLIEETKSMEGVVSTPKEEISREKIEKLTRRIAGESSTEDPKLPKVKPFVEETKLETKPQFEAKGGAKTLRRILKAQEEVEKIKRGPSPEEIKRRVEKLAQKVAGETPTPKELPKVKPFVEETKLETKPQFEAKGGAEPLRRILKAQRQMEKEQEERAKKALEKVKKGPYKVPPTSSTPFRQPPSPTPAEQQIPKPQKMSLFSRILNKIKGKN